MTDALQIHQALYGYQDGHRLLESSADLSSEASRSILPLSDGPDLQVKVPAVGYLSGYPVSSIDCFALSMTWPAPEMPRPGCVWTHVLLIRPNVLASIRDPRGLLSCFRRPQGPDPDRLTYSVPLTYRNLSLERGEESHVDTDMSKTLIYWLYRTEEPLVFRGEERSDGEGSVLAIWGQQWPDLRRNFSFISIPSTREVSSRPFDLRLVFDSDPVLERALGAEIHSPSDPLPSEEEWLTWATRDISSAGGFREVLWHYGSEAGVRRGAFASIAQVYAVAQRSLSDRIEDAMQLLRTVGRCFPEPDQMRGLKLDLFGHAESALRPRLVGDSLHWAGSDATMLFALAVSPEQRALNAEELDLSNRARKLWVESREQALELLQVCAESPGKPVSDSVIEALLPLAVRDPELVTQNAPAAVPLAITHDPAFAANSSVWRGSEPEIERRWGVLSSIPSLGDARKEVVRALVGSGAPSAVGRALGRWGQAIVADLLEVVGDPGAPRLSEGWMDVLRDNPDAVVQWLSSSRRPPKRRQMELIAETADPQQIARLDLPLLPWIEWITDSHGDYLTPNQLTFLFQLGLASPDPSAALLLREAFIPLLEELSRNPAASQLFPGKQIKTKFKSSDGKSVRISPLTMALATRWRERGWPVAALLEPGSDPAILAEMVAAYAQTKKGTKEVERYLSSLDEEHNSTILRAVPSDLRPPSRKH